MIYELDGKEYPVIVEKKKNKNTYIRVKEDQRILVTTHYLVTNRQIMDLITRNENAIRKMIQKRVNKQERNEKFYYLGSIYDIIIVPTLEEMDIVGDKIYVKSNHIYKLINYSYFIQKNNKINFSQNIHKKYNSNLTKISYFETFDQARGKILNEAKNFGCVLILGAGDINELAYSLKKFKK